MPIKKILGIILLTTALVTPSECGKIRYAGMDTSDVSLEEVKPALPSTAESSPRKSLKERLAEKRSERESVSPSAESKVGSEEPTAQPDTTVEPIGEPSPSPVVLEREAEEQEGRGEEERWDDDGFLSSGDNYDVLLFYLMNSQYDKIDALITNYIRENKPGDLDSSHAIAKILKGTKAVAIYKKCIRLPVDGLEYYHASLEEDDYDDGYDMTEIYGENDDALWGSPWPYLYQEDRTIITSQRHIIPYILGDELYYEIGAIGIKGYDTVLVNVDGDIFMSGGYEWTEEEPEYIIAAGSALLDEDEAGNLSDSLIEEIVAGKIEMFFENSDTEKRKSVSIGAADRSALKEMYYLQKAHDMILKVMSDR
jgi:hypothetical protein